MTNNVIVGILFMILSALSFGGLVATLAAEKPQILMATCVVLSVVFCKIAMHAFKYKKIAAKA
ncbi:hypothetical protein [Bacillus bombysepticus]|uniref:hypothetical protein n=1 Tax=Bacillus bombysepticus TaxID=658666 RepID=UPI00301800DA